MFNRTGPLSSWRSKGGSCALADERECQQLSRGAGAYGSDDDEDSEGDAAGAAPPVPGRPKMSDTAAAPQPRVSGGDRGGARREAAVYSGRGQGT